MKPEYEIYNLTCTTIFEKLRETIKGYIKVYVVDGRLVIYIENNDFTFDYKLDNYLDYVLEFGTEKIVTQTRKEFSKAVNARFFK